MSKQKELYGLVAEFASPTALLKAARAAYQAGYRKMEAYTPFPVEGLAEALDHRPSRLPWLVLLAALGGGGGAYLLQWYTATVAYPLRVGGRAAHSWPAFVPVSFEAAVLAGALACVLALFVRNRLPKFHHPLFEVPGFGRATRDRFFLCVESSDALFDPEFTQRFLWNLEPLHVKEAHS